MKIKLDLNAADLAALNDPSTEQTIIDEAYALLTEIFNNRDSLIKCSITLDGDK